MSDTSAVAIAGWEPWPGADEADWREWESGDRTALLPTMGNTAPSGIFALETDLATADPSGLGDADLVDAAVGLERIAAWARARQYAVLAEFARRRGDGSIRPAPVPAADRRAWAADEVGLALQLAPGSAGARLADAVRLDGVLRPTRELLAAGRLDESRARLVATVLAELDDEKARAVQARVLPAAPGQTWGQLRAALRRAVLAVDADGAAERHRRAVRSRRVDLFDGEDGMATLWARLSAVDAASCFAWITRLARGLPAGPDGTDGADSTGGTDGRGGIDGSGGDEADRAGAGAGRAGLRSMDARRADVLVALLTGRLQVLGPDGEPGGPGEAGGSAVAVRPVGADRPLVQVVVPLGTVSGAGEEPGELVGFGPIPAHLAREVAADPGSTWRRILTDPGSGVVLDHGRARYRPPVGLADLVRARDGGCRHPGCRRAAKGCELDHVVAWRDGGATSEANLVLLCPRHHLLKEQPGWRVVLHADRSLEWITPTGHRYRSRPVDHRLPEPPVAAPPSPPPSPPVGRAGPSVLDLLRSPPVPDEAAGDPPPF